MTLPFYKHLFSLFIFMLAIPVLSIGQNKSSAYISGELSLDDTWDSIIYLSHISTYEDMYSMSNEMIIAKASINNLGYFNFDLDFLPQGENLYRLHLIKKGDTPATLTIGGKHENHLFFISNSFSKINLESNSSNPPFRTVSYTNSTVNSSFQELIRLVFKGDSIAAESSASKRLLIESQLQNDLFQIADTSSNLLVSLYALYKTENRSDYSSNENFYNSYFNKWKHKEDSYLKSFTSKFPQTETNNRPVYSFLLAIVLIIVGFFIGKKVLKKDRKLDKLSVQERKIYSLLQESATNQEISNQLNIGLSTVKSHATSIYSKLKVKSRKDIINMK